MELGLHTDVGEKTDCCIDPYLILLTIPHCVIFKIPLALLLILGQACSTGSHSGLLWLQLPQLEAVKLTVAALSMALSLSANWI